MGDETPPVTCVATTSLAELLDPVRGRRMELPGFDQDFVDFPDYIIRITDQIWHQRQIEKCLDYYSTDCVIHTLAGDITGAQTVVDNTYATLDAFPDRRLEADNVIWSQENEDTFYSSHLITSLMTNEGRSEFGPATGRKVQVLTIADCVCRENRIVEEWLVRDNAGLTLQLGFSPDEIAKDQAAQGTSLIAFHSDAHREVRANPLEDAKIPEKAQDSPSDFARGVFSQIWQQRKFGLMEQVYDFRVDAHFPGNRRLYGPAMISAALRELFSAFPDADIRIDHIADIPYLSGARDIAVRWSLAATHSGDGAYGNATGAPVFIIGVTQWRVIGNQIHAEWTVWDDIAVRRQIEEARAA